MKKINQSHLVFLFMNLLFLLLFNEMQHWMTQFIVSLWILISALLIFTISYSLYEFFKVTDIYLLVSTYLLTYVFVTTFFAVIGPESEPFVNRLKYFYYDKELALKVTLPFLLSMFGSLLFFKYRTHTVVNEE